MLFTSVCYLYSFLWLPDHHNFRVLTAGGTNSHDNLAWAMAMSKADLFCTKPVYWSDMCRDSMADACLLRN